MTKAQKIQMKMSELREQVNALYATDKPEEIARRDNLVTKGSRAWKPSSGHGPGV